MKINTIPTEATIYFTDVCNFSCAGCSRQTVGKPKHKEMDLETIQKVLVAYPSIESFCIAGLGEPTIGKHFPEVINHLLDKGKYVGIITNGTYPERLLQLTKSPSYISISLYGSNNLQYKEWTKVEAFEKVKQNYKKLKSRFGNVGFSYILNKENYKKLDEIIKVCDELQPSFLNLVNYLVYDSTEQKEIDKIIMLDDVDIINYIEERCGSRSYINVRPIYNDRNDLEFNCPSYERTINIDGYGNIGGCQRQIIPGIQYGSFEFNDDPYNSIPMQMLRQEINEGHYPHKNCFACFGRFNPFSIREKVVRITGTVKQKLAIMILFHEKVEQTIECVKSFLPSGNNIYILNNGSSKESTLVLKDFCKNHNQIKIFDAGKNLGVGVGRNYLIDNTREEWMFFVDNDIYVTNNEWYDEFLVLKTSYPSIEAFIPKLFNIHESSYVTYHNVGIKDNHIVSFKSTNGLINNFPGGASIIRRPLFERMGKYDDKMFVGLEDFEFVLRGLISNDPVRAILVDSIELVHDHKKIEKKVDKNAVMVRYDEELIQNSFDRMKQKYPEINVQHEWRNWVREQKRSLIEFDNVDLSLLTEERNYSSRAKTRMFIKKDKEQLCSEYTDEQLLSIRMITEKISGSLIIQISDKASEGKTKQLLGLGLTLNSFNNSESSNYSSKVNFSINSEIDKTLTPFEKKQPVLIILDHILEKLNDPRYLLRAIKRILLNNQDCTLLVFSKERSSKGINYTCDESSYREWLVSELEMFLSSGGFTSNKAAALQTETESTICIELKLDAVCYNKFLESAGLPKLNMRYLICSNEHGKAKLSGGIGSYVEEAEKLFLENELGVFLVGKGDLLPERKILYENRLISFTKFFDQNTIHYNSTSDLLLNSIKVIQYLYPYLTTVEIQDVEGYAVRLVQGKKSNQICSSIKVQICAHGNKIQMERVFEEWLDPLDYETVYKEKIALENADVVVFPTNYMKSLYKNAGYLIDDEKNINLRLPFTFKEFPKNNYQHIDTLIFYGKRIVVKGYDLFAEVVSHLDIDEIIGKQITRIILIGPKFKELQRVNDYIDTLKKRLEIVEVSTSREKAIQIIEQNSHRALCLLPYKSDNHPYSLLEIIQTGCSFVVSNTGGILEMIPENYWFEVSCTLESKKFANHVKQLLAKSQSDRYELFLSLYTRMKSLQEYYNNQFVQNNNYNKAAAFGESAQLTSTVIAALSDTDYNYNVKLISALENQSVCPNKVFFLYKDDGAVQNIWAGFESTSLTYEAIKYINYSEIRNDLLKNINTDTVLLIKENDLPLNEFVEASLVYLSTNKDYSCVSSYLSEFAKDSDINDHSNKEKEKKPFGEWGLLNINGKNYYGTGSTCYRAAFLKSINGWAEESDVDDLNNYYKIISNSGKVGVICQPLVLRIKIKTSPVSKRYFDKEIKTASNYYHLDKFDSYRISGLIQSNSLVRSYTEIGDIPELEKYLISVQTLLVNGKVGEASELLGCIKKQTFDEAPKELQNKIRRIRSKTDEIIKKVGIIKPTSENRNNSNPLVSVIIPTYNRPEQLKEAIYSVLNQSYRNLEVHVVNDAGEDVEGIIYSFTDSRLHYHVHKTNKGLAGARNTGIIKSTGEYIALLDDDDIFLSNHLEIAIAELSKGKEVVYTDAIRAAYKKHNSKYNLVSKKVPYSIEYNRNKLLLSNIAPVNCFVFNKKLINKCGLFNEEFSVLEDWEFWLRLSKETSFHHIKNTTAQVTWKNDGTTMTSSKQELFNLFREKIYLKYKDEIQNIPNQNEIIAEFKLAWVDNDLTQPVLSIIVPTYNQLNYTKEFIASLYSNTAIPFELIVIINDKNDGTEYYLKELSKTQNNIKLVVNEENKGFPVSINQGLRIAECDYYLIANNDIVVTKGSVEKMLNVLNNHSQTGIVGPISNEVSGIQKDKSANYSSIDEMHFYAESIATKNKDDLINFPRIAFLCTLMKKEVVDKIGGLDERFTPGNYEDDDYCLRAQLAGFKTVIAKDVFIHHYGSKSFKAEGNSKYLERLKQNEVKFIKKWGVTPDELWIKNKKIKEHSIFYPIEADIVKQSVNRSKIHLADKEYDLAFSELENAYNHYDENAFHQIISQADLLNLLGNVALIVGLLEKAKQYFEEELSINPESASACLGLGVVFQSTAENENAKTMFEWAVKNDPNNKAAQESLAMINGILGFEETHNSLSIEV